MIFEIYAIWPNMTVGENVGFGLQVRRLSRGEIDRRVDAILDIVQMRGLKARYPAGLVGGPRAARAVRPRHRRRARVAAARRAAQQPRRQPARGDALRDPPAA